MITIIITTLIMIVAGCLFAHDDFSKTLRVFKESHRNGFNTNIYLPWITYINWMTMFISFGILLGIIINLFLGITY